MKINKITFKEDQAWIVLMSETDGRYLGTWHCNDERLVKKLRIDNPKELIFDTEIVALTEKIKEKKT